MTTRENILDTAEELFAINGISATSLRTIISKAKVNIAAVHYHFGSREGLIKEVFSRRISLVNEIRMQKLSELKRIYTNQPIPYREILRAFITPAITMGLNRDKKTKSFMKLMGRLHCEESLFKDQLMSEFAPTIKEFTESLKVSLPNQTEEEISWKFFFVIGTMVFTILNVQDAKIFSKELDLKDFESFIEKILSFIASGFNAEN